MVKKDSQIYIDWMKHIKERKELMYKLEIQQGYKFRVRDIQRFNAVTYKSFIAKNPGLSLLDLPPQHYDTYGKY